MRERSNNVIKLETWWQVTLSSHVQSRLIVEYQERTQRERDREKERLCTHSIYAHFIQRSITKVMLGRACRVNWILKNVQSRNWKSKSLKFWHWATIPLVGEKGVFGGEKSNTHVASVQIFTVKVFNWLARRRVSLIMKWRTTISWSLSHEANYPMHQRWRHRLDFPVWVNFTKVPKQLRSRPHPMSFIE